MVHRHTRIEHSNRFESDPVTIGDLHPDPDEDVQLCHDLRAPEGLLAAWVVPKMTWFSPTKPRKDHDISGETKLSVCWWSTVKTVEQPTKGTHFRLSFAEFHPFFQALNPSKTIKSATGSLNSAFRWSGFSQRISKPLRPTMMTQVAYAHKLTVKMDQKNCAIRRKVFDQWRDPANKMRALTENAWKCEDFADQN